MRLPAHPLKCVIPTEIIQENRKITLTHCYHMVWRGKQNQQKTRKDVKMWNWLRSSDHWHDHWQRTHWIRDPASLYSEIWTFINALQAKLWLNLIRICFFHGSVLNGPFLFHFCSSCLLCASCCCHSCILSCLTICSCFMFFVMHFCTHACFRLCFLFLRCVLFSL